ncbi:MAG: ClbS/DfsB family four-helix bundle protein [Thermoflexales bacterium]|nr:ClbS/DfsB family four-helix bundle protein [Thermoflexales bacterium]
MGDAKTRMIELLDRAYADLQAFSATLSDADCAAVGTLKQWAIKDAISHSTMWQQRAIERVNAIVRGEEPVNADDYLGLNDAHFVAYRERSWVDTIGEAEETYRALVALTQSLSEEDLTDPHRFAHLKNQPLLRVIVGSGFAHSEAHLAQLYVERGEIERANQLQETATDLLETIPEERTVARYNLACYYAVSGQSARALTELTTALQSHPELVEWSKQDSDLDSLRADPAYQALYQPA